MSSTSVLEDQQRALVAEVAEVEAAEARLYARKMRLRAQMDELWNGGGFAQEQFGVLELAGTARIGQARASSQLVDGPRLRDQLPSTLAALESGTTYRETGVLMLQLTTNCSAEVTREVERRALPTILTGNTTDIRRLVRKLIPEVEADLEPELTKRRLDNALAERDVTQHDRGNGMTGVLATMGMIESQRWALDFDEICRAQKVLDDKRGIVRTAAQRRADVLAQLPSRFLALVRGIQRGEIEQLLAIAQTDPNLADDLEELAATLPCDDGTIPDGPEPTEAEPFETVVRDDLMGTDPQVLADLHGVAHDTDPRDGLAETWHPSRAIDPAQAVPLEPPPDEARDPDPPDGAPHWTGLSWRELTSTILGLAVKNPAVLNAHIPMTTLLELDNRSGTVEGAGGGALPAHHARMLLPTADLRRVFTDPDSGVPIGIDPTIIRANRPAPGRDPRLEDLLTPFVLREVAQPQHDPSGRLRGFVELRDQHCTGIGCSQPAGRCHLDHETAYPSGPTASWNLGAKSARCHRAKHAGWTVTRHGPGPQHGEATWTSPLGHSYTRPSAWHHPGTARSHTGADPIIEIELPAHGQAA